MKIKINFTKDTYPLKLPKRKKEKKERSVNVTLVQ